MLTVAVLQQKKGAGKTTLAINLAAAAHLEGAHRTWPRGLEGWTTVSPPVASSPGAMSGLERIALEANRDRDRVSLGRSSPRSVLPPARLKSHVERRALPGP
jgi:Mrp family chromosome partitioning ATPase